MTTTPSPGRSACGLGSLERPIGAPFRAGGRRRQLRRRRRPRRRRRRRRRRRKRHRRSPASRPARCAGGDVRSLAPAGAGPGAAAALGRCGRRGRGAGGVRRAAAGDPAFSRRGDAGDVPAGDRGQAGAPPPAGGRPLSRLASEDRPGPRDPEQDACRRQLGMRLRAALDRLPMPQRVAFVLCVVEELSSAQAAAIAAVPEATVRTRLFHARRRLRGLLDGERER
jgi:RNA polymerase sigma factor (sigma-70 family)